MQQSKPRNIAVAALAVAFMLAAAGCQGQKNKDKKEANGRWNRTRASVLASLAADQFKAGSFEKCRKTVNDALKMDPENAQVRVLSAKLAIEQGQLEVAQSELDLARKFAPNEAEAYYLSGVVFQRWQKPQTAYEFYATAATKAPSELSYVLAQAEMLVDLGRRDEALTVLQAKVQYFENSPAIRDAAGQLLMQSKRYGEAVDMFRQSSVLEESEMAYRERLGLALYYDKQYVEAAEVLGKLLELEAYKSRSDLLTALGESQMQIGKPRDARRSFEAATQIDASSSTTWLGLGRAAMETNDFKRAELALKKAQTIDPNGSEPHLLLGYVRLRQNRLPDALAAFKKASAVDPKDTVSLCMIGYVYEKTGRQDLAMQYYGRVLKTKPNDRLASRLMAGVNLND